jgi:heme A synthase
MSSQASAPAPRRERVLANASVALMAIVVVASAFIRLARPGLECAAGPDCTAGAREPALAAMVAVARGMHRIAAAGVGLALVALTAAAVARRPRDRGAIVLAVAALVLTVVLAAAGARGAERAAGGPAAGTTFVNAFGGLALLAVLWRVRIGTLVRATPATRAARAAAGLALAAAAAWIATDTAIAAGLASDQVFTRIVRVALAGLGASGLVACVLLARGRPPQRRLAVVIAVLVAAVITTASLGRPGGSVDPAVAIASGLVHVVAVALLLGALVGAASGHSV